MEEISYKKRKTTYSQFQKLVGLMGEHPHLATGIPLFGVSRADIESTWDTVTTKVNSIGPPERSKTEWKKIWADLKFRTKKIVAENNKRRRESGDEENSRLRTLTPLEFAIDKICHFSSPTDGAASGESNGGANDVTKTSQTTLTQNIPTEKQTPNKETAQESLETVTKRKRSTSTQSQYQPPNNTHPTRRTFQQRKRKSYNEKPNDKNEQMKLLRQQIDMQHVMLDAMKLQAESAEASAEALQDIAESTKMMAKAMLDVAKHFTGADYKL